MKKHLIYALAIQFLLFSIQISCSGEKPTEKEAPSLVETWYLLTVKISGEVVNPNTLVDVPVKMILKSDGTGQVWESDYGQPAIGPRGFNWHTSGNQFVIQLDGDPDVVALTFVLTENTLILLSTDGLEIIFEKK